MLQPFLLLIQMGMFFDYSYCGVTKKRVQMPPELAGAIAAVVQKCQSETGIRADALLLIYDGKYRQDEQFKNFIFCSYKSAGFLSSDGHLNEDKAIQTFKNEPLIKEGIKRCGQEKGKNPEESLFKFYKCFVDTTPVQFTLW